MANIFVNGLNSKTGGGKSILNNYLTLLKKSESNDKYFILTPNKYEYVKYENEFIKIVDINSFYKKGSLFFITYRFILPKLIVNLKIDVIFNLADIPIPIKKVRQVFLFDWPYAVYPESEVWNMMDMKSLVMRKIKLYFFKSYLKYITTMIAQTETIKNRLARIYGIEDIKVVPNAVSLDNMDGGEYKDFNLPDGKKLLYLTYYYPHKNLEIFIPLAKEIKKRNLDFKIIITIEESQHQNVKAFLDLIREQALDETIINLGPIEMKNVPSLYKQCDGLLMPTLLETYGLPYIEAMYNELSIFTSDIDFALDVCKKSAYYFDELDSKNIFKTLEDAYNNDKARDIKIIKGKENLKSLLNWNEVLNKYKEIIKDELND